MGVCGVLRRILIIMQECSESDECDPKMALSWNLKGLALNYKGEYNKAIEAFDRAIDLAPEWEVPRNNKTAALQELNWPKKADIEIWCNPKQEMPYDELSPICSTK